MHLYLKNRKMRCHQDNFADSAFCHFGDYAVLSKFYAKHFADYAVLSKVSAQHFADYAVFVKSFCKML